MKKVLFAMAVSAVVVAISALADGTAVVGCPKAKECPMAAKANCPASTNAPACTNAPVAAQPAK